MRYKIYNFLVNRKEGIRQRYHQFHDGSTGIVKILSWLYLFWLNFAYYILQFKFLGRVPELRIYEEKKLNCDESESQAFLTKNSNLRIDEFVRKLSEYEVISFDVFDTLIFRPFSAPTDVFYLIGESLGIMDFKNIRIKAEYDARIKRRELSGDMEIGIADIWNELEAEVGIPAGRGISLEEETEKELCYANPFMLEVWKLLRAMGKRLFVVSDMYLPESIIEELLKNAGFDGAERIFVSCEYHKSKADGKLYTEVLNVFSHEKKMPSIIHIGDNPHSDVKMALEKGIAVMQYPNVNKNVQLYRAFDMSYMVGSAYRAVVDNRIYSGADVYTIEYEYGFIYGGLFALGYCNFIHEYCLKNSVDKVLFFSRDGDVLKKVYDLMYPDERTEYVYWSRKAATKLGAVFDRHDYFRRFVMHKVNQGYSIGQILNSMGLDFLMDELPCSMKADDELTNRNAIQLREFVVANWDRVAECYDTENRAAKSYYEKVLDGCGKVLAVDIGWAGSGAMVLRHLVADEWKLSCEIIGMIAGTNTLHNAEPDAAEAFLQSGKLVSYLYSQSHNRDLLKKHDPDRGYNVFWELLLSSPTPKFEGFECGDVRREQSNDRYIPENDITLCFGGCDFNADGIKNIQSGILDFVRDYTARFKHFPYMLNISGRDAYAPMLVAAGNNEKYLKVIESRFALEINVN